MLLLKPCAPPLLFTELIICLAAVPLLWGLCGPSPSPDHIAVPSPMTWAPRGCVIWGPIHPYLLTGTERCKGLRTLAAQENAGPPCWPVTGHLFPSFFGAEAGVLVRACPCLPCWCSLVPVGINRGCGALGSKSSGATANCRTRTDELIIQQATMIGSSMPG